MLVILNCMFLGTIVVAALDAKAGNQVQIPCNHSSINQNITILFWYHNDKIILSRYLVPAIYDSHGYYTQYDHSTKLYYNENNYDYNTYNYTGYYTQDIFDYYGTTQYSLKAENDTNIMYLIIDNVQKSNAGKYECITQSKNFDQHHEQHNLTVDNHDGSHDKHNLTVDNHDGSHDKQFFVDVNNVSDQSNIYDTLIIVYDISVFILLIIFLAVLLVWCAYDRKNHMILLKQRGIAIPLQSIKHED
ncbi:putative immunoglobulin-like domain containing protein [Namao virus]|nr:putative immunoglobulin-like domain containing protein [Namao virus]